MDHAEFSVWSALNSLQSDFILHFMFLYVSYSFYCYFVRTQ